MNHAELKQKLLSNSKTLAAYEDMRPEFSLLKQMLKAREVSGLSQAEIAKRMGTKPPSITRLETSLGSGKHSPSLATLRKYAEAVGCELQVNFVKPKHS